MHADEKKIPITENQHPKPDIIIIGAGPCGLWEAIQLKLWNPTRHILVFEKYKEYQRHHVLKLDQTSYAGAHPELKPLIKDLIGFVPTSTIENTFLTKAKELGIQIIYRKIENCENLISEFPNCNIIIGADGARSQVRKTIFQDKMDFQENLNNIVELKYQIKGKGTALTASQYARTLVTTHHFIVEYIGKEKEGKTSISLRFFVDDKTFDALKEARGANYFNLNHKQIPASLRESIQTWLKSRDYFTHETIVAESEKITVTNLDVYCSKKAILEHKGVKFFLVGDAYCGLPYFRSLNNGLKNATQLAIALTAYLNNKKTELFVGSHKITVDPIISYEKIVSANTNSERRKAKLKNYGLKTTGVAISSMQTSYGTSVEVSNASSQLLSFSGLRSPMVEDEKYQSNNESSHSLCKIS